MMGESSTCVVRSFSTPADTSCVVTHEGNPLCALGESISFGRFMSESLNWEKWSTFSHNRYVEEAEKYSKPGTVAAKKAYFEAHYKRKAAEKAAALIQEANAQANGTFDYSENREGICTDSSIQMESSGADNIEAANEQLDEDTANYQVVDCVDTNQYKCDDVGQSGLDISEVEGAEDVPHPCSDTNVKVESCMLVDDSNSNQLDHVEVHKDITVPIEDRAPDPVLQGTADQEVLALPVKGREVNSSPKSSAKTRTAKLSHSRDERKAAAAVPLPPRNGINRDSKGKSSVGGTVEKKRLTARSLHASINLPSGTGETSKTAAAALRSRNGLNSFSTSKKSVVGSVEKRLTARSLHMSINLPSGTGETSKTTTAAALRSRNGLNSFSTSKKSVGGSVEKKGLTAQSLHMSINLPSDTGETSKTTTTAVKPRNGINSAPKKMKSVGDSVEKRPTARSLRMSINLPSGTGETSKTASMFKHNRNKNIYSNLPKVHPVASRTSTQDSHGLLNQASANLPSQGRRTERLLNKSVSGGVTVNAKLSSLSVDCLKSSSTTKSNPGPFTISSPFRFRSEERAIKRKEFLQRMDETKSKEEEKVQLQRIPKGKTEHDHKNLQHSSGSKSKLSEDRPSGSQSPGNQIRKISVTLARSPKPVRKASSTTVQDKKLGNSWKPPISTNRSKRITEKINRTRQSGTSLSNTTRENASPNIQH